MFSAIDCVKYVFLWLDLGSDEESGKDWSDLEREAEEEDKNYATKDDFVSNQKSSKKSSHDRDRHHRDKHKSSKR